MYAICYHQSGWAKPAIYPSLWSLSSLNSWTDFQSSHVKKLIEMWWFELWTSYTYDIMLLNGAHSLVLWNMNITFVEKNTALALGSLKNNFNKHTIKIQIYKQSLIQFRVLVNKKCFKSNILRLCRPQNRYFHWKINSDFVTIIVFLYRLEIMAYSCNPAT